MSIQPKLSAFDLTMIVVSLVIGVGIFRTPTIVAASANTPGLFFTAWVLGGFVSLCGALTYAEIGSRFSVPGGFYQIISHCFHPAYAFMLNWVYVLTLGAGAAGVAIIGAEYINPIVFPGSWQGESLIKVTVFGIVLALFILNYLGIKVGARTQNFLTLVKIMMLLSLCLAVFGQPTHPLEIGNTVPATGNTSWLTALAVSLIPVFYTYGGYQGTINFGGDIVNPRKNIPLAVMVGIGIIISLYLLINYAYYRMLGLAGIAQSKQVAAELARAFYGDYGYTMVSVAIFLSVLGFVNVMLMQIPRMYFAMAEDRILPPVFKKVNQQTQVQEFALIFITGIMLLSVFFLGTFEKIVNYVMFIDSLSLTTAAVTLFILRKRQRGKDEPHRRTDQGFRVPVYPIVPLIFILFLASISINVLITDTVPALIGFGFFLGGYPLYRVMQRLYPTEKEKVPMG